MKISNKIKELTLLFEGWLEAESALFESEDMLSDAIRYSLKAPGKRIRPVLALASAEMLGVELIKLRGYCLALEFVHTASLVHDDLPCMDDDSFRRGQPCCHKVYGEANALLVGDALIANSFAAINCSEEISAATKIKLSKLLSRAVFDLCQGQVLDLNAASNHKSDADPQQLLEQRHLKKTAALISAALVGAVHYLDDGAGDISSKINALGEFGADLGLLFQITDDILDATQSTEQLGKDADSDRRQELPTYVSVYGLSQAKEIAGQRAQLARKRLELFGNQAEVLLGLVDYVLERTR